MISNKWKPTYVSGGRRQYIFIKECRQAGDVFYHFFIFDEVGGCSETRYFCHPRYLRQIEESVMLTEDGDPRTVWELEPHSVSGYPPPFYSPVLEQVMLSNEQHLCVDKRYAIEILRTSTFHSYLCESQSTQEKTDAPDTPSAAG